MRRSNKTKRVSRESIAPIIRRPNATSATSRIAIPYWAYSLKPMCRVTRKNKKTKNRN
jgi:hypothetical protein